MHNNSPSFSDSDDMPSPEEQAAVRASLRELDSGEVTHETSSTLFEEEFAAKHGIRFRSDPPDAFQFEYAKGMVIWRNMQPGGSGGDGGGIAPPSEAPIDLKQENEHPFSIKVEVLSRGIDGDWSTARVQVVSGTYQIDGGPAYNANGVAFPDFAYNPVSPEQKSSMKGFAYLLIPLVIDDIAGVPAVNIPNKVRAIDGGVIKLRNMKAIVWPQVVKVAGGIATAVEIGTWGVQRVNVSAGVPSYKIRVQIDQKVTDNIVLGGPSENSEQVLPAGSSDGDLFFWDAATEKWVALTAPPTSGKWAVAVKDGVMQWLPAVDC
jgi:hypothetical protein